MSDRFTQTPEPPYYVVIFTSLLSENDAGYDAMGDRMFALALEQSGCLGVESAWDAERLGITVSYWRDEQSIKAWKSQAQHLVAQKYGIEKWYAHYTLRIAKVERAYGGPEGRDLAQG